MDTPALSIIVPVYNEAACLRELHSQITRALANANIAYEIIAVDDGSTDETLPLLRQLAQNDARFRFISLKRNFGQTAALAAGFDNALGEYFVTLDGDLQNDPADIPALYKACRRGGYDIVAGWRKKRRDPFFTKVLPSILANYLIRKITGVLVHDTGCSLKIIRRSAIADLHLYGEMHRFIPALLHWTGSKIGEIEVNHRPRTQGKSKYGLEKLPRVLLDILNIKFLISYSTRPIQIFGKMGLYALLASVLSGLILIAMKLHGGVDMTGNPFLLLTVFLGFVGIQFITLGLLGEINIRTYHEATRCKIYRISESSQ
ncbi:MAG: glycosyltransferase family 2 protein [Fibrobacterota bacterium]